MDHDKSQGAGSGSQGRKVHCQGSTSSIENGASCRVRAEQRPLTSQNFLAKRKHTVSHQDFASCRAIEVDLAMSTGRSNVVLCRRSMKKIACDNRHHRSVISATEQMEPNMLAGSERLQFHMQRPVIPVLSG
jgi:hypothetical protein